MRSRMATAAPMDERMIERGRHWAMLTMVPDGAAAAMWVVMGMMKSQLTRPQMPARMPRRPSRIEMTPRTLGQVEGRSKEMAPGCVGGAVGRGGGTI